MNKIEKQNERDAKVEELLLKVDYLVELVQDHLLVKPAKDVIKKKGKK